MIKTGNKEIDYLIVLLNCALKKTVPPAPENIDMKKLLKLAVAQQVYNTVLPCLEELNILDDSEKAQWNNYKLSELQKTIYVNSQREAVCADLDEAGIDYMFLKGLIIREYYPQSLMRQMSDNDIMYDESRRDDLYKIMKRHGFYNGAAAGISDDFYKDTCTIEFHRTLFNPKDDFCPEFHPFEHAKKLSTDSHRYIMSAEDNYIYALSHMYKHYHCIDGCGIRFICDLYLLTEADDNLDWDYINQTVERFGISDFQKTALGVCDAVFKDKEPNEEEKELINFMFRGTVYGFSTRTIDDDIAEAGGKFKYLVHRLFPPKEEMLGNYYKLQKKPYLLPVYYIIRLFKKSFQRSDALKKELNDLKNNN